MNENAPSKILVAGFDRFFPRHLVRLPNTASTLVQRLAARLPADRFEFLSRVPVAWDAHDIIQGEAEERKVDAIVIVGSAPTLFRRVRAEKQAACRPSHMKDVRGASQPALPVAPQTVYSDGGLLAHALSAGRGVKRGRQHSAGRYVCGWTLYHVTQGRRPTLLIHIPQFVPVRFGALETVERAMRAIARGLRRRTA